MKKVISTVLLVLMSLSLVACGKNEDEKKEIIPQSSQMKSICELATMDCYYHNVIMWQNIMRKMPPVSGFGKRTESSG